jgi:FAD/FMN-containing dehydrogenase
MAGQITRRELLKRGALAGAAISVPFIHYRFARAAEEIDPALVYKFGASLKGRLILPRDKDYDTARRVWNPKYDKHPAMIARCAATEDVARTVEFARKNNLPVSVRSGGHDQAGFSTNDGGVVVDLAGLKRIKVDRAGMRVSAEGGVQVGELYNAVVPAGAGVVSGSCRSVGIGGLTLGAGESAISNKYGLACDNVTSMEVVSADGRMLSARANENPDLFWALRGGSGNFGVVTRFEYRLVPGNRLVAGTLTYPMAKRRHVMRFYRDFIASAPDELTTEAVFGTPFADDVFGISVVYCGDAKDGERVLKPLRAGGPPAADSIKEVSFLEAVTEDEPAPLANCARDGFFSPLSDEAIDVLCAHLEGPHPIYQIGILDMHGAACRGDSAFQLRRPALDAWTWGFWRSDSERDRTIAWVDQLWAGIGKYTDGAYVNGLEANEGEARVRAAYGKNYERLAAIKNKYDPTNFFRMNQNIKPTTV